MQTEWDNMTRVFTLLQRAGAGSAVRTEPNNGSAPKVEVLGGEGLRGVRTLHIYPSLSAAVG